MCVCTSLSLRPSSIDLCLCFVLSSPQPIAMVRHGHSRGSGVSDWAARITSSGALWEFTYVLTSTSSSSRPASVTTATGTGAAQRKQEAGGRRQGWGSEKRSPAGRIKAPHQASA